MWEIDALIDKTKDAESLAHTAVWYTPYSLDDHHLITISADTWCILEGHFWQKTPIWPAMEKIAEQWLADGRSRSMNLAVCRIADLMLGTVSVAQAEAHMADHIVAPPIPAPSYDEYMPAQLLFDALIAEVGGRPESIPLFCQWADLYRRRRGAAVMMAAYGAESHAPLAQSDWLRRQEPLTFILHEAHTVYHLARIARKAEANGRDADVISNTSRAQSDWRARSKKAQNRKAESAEAYDPYLDARGEREREWLLSLPMPSSRALDAVAARLRRRLSDEPVDMAPYWLPPEQRLADDWEAIAERNPVAVLLAAHDYLRGSAVLGLQIVKALSAAPAQ